MLAKQVIRKTSPSLMHEEHVKHAELNYGLIRTSAHAVENVSQHPLRGPGEIALPDGAAGTDERGDEEHRSAADLHSGRDPEDVDQAEEEVVECAAAVHVGEGDAGLFADGCPGGWKRGHSALFW